MAEFVQRSGSYIIRGPGQIYAGRAENLLVAQHWTRLLQGREEEIRRAMHAGRRDIPASVLSSTPRLLRSQHRRVPFRKSTGSEAAVTRGEPL